MYITIKLVDYKIMLFLQVFATEQRFFYFCPNYKKVILPLKVNINNETLKRMKRAANLENVSFSKWIVAIILNAVDSNYWCNYFCLFGSV